MYIKDKREGFQMYTSVFHVLFPRKSHGIHKHIEISYKEIDLIQCMNIINGGITKCMIMYDQVPGLPRSTSFVRRHF